VYDSCFEIEPSVWKKIYKENKNGLVGKWTNVLYDALCGLDEKCCPLAFKQNRIKKQFTDKLKIDFYTGLAKCMYPNCPRRYNLLIKKKPATGTPVRVDVCITGTQDHPEGIKIVIFTQNCFKT
jgi:hypothetical protein